MRYEYNTREKSDYNIGAKSADKINNHLSRGSEEQYSDAKLQI